MNLFTSFLFSSLRAHSSKTVTVDFDRNSPCEANIFRFLRTNLLVCNPLVEGHSFVLPRIYMECISLANLLLVTSRKNVLLGQLLFVS